MAYCRTSLDAVILIAAAAAMLVGVPGMSLAQQIDCPSSLTVREQPEAAAGWTARSGTATYALQRISIMSGEIGEEQKPASADLAPDTQKPGTNGRVTQTWSLDDYRDGQLLLVCRYVGTDALVVRTIPKSVRTCQQTLTLSSATHGAVGSVMSCK